MILMIVIIIVLLLLQTPKILQKAFWEQFMKLFFKFLEDLTKLLIIEGSLSTMLNQHSDLRRS